MSKRPFRHFGFYTSGPIFEGDALEHGPLGGSETAFIQITRALVRRGHRVTAFNNCLSPGCHHGVDFRPFKESVSVLVKEYFDIFVVSRFFGFFTLPLNAGLKVLWNHDTLDQPRDLRIVHDEIDLFLVLSDFHRDNFLTRLPDLEDRLVTTRNGLDLELLDRAAAGIVRRNDYLLYASRPERGLRQLLEDIWPRLKAARPNLRLGLCGYKVERHNLPHHLTELYDYLDLLGRKTDGVDFLGALGKEDYYRQMARAAMVVYPCSFPEISCLVALEAQALGAPVITTDGFALAESVVEPQWRVAGRPNSAAYSETFVERVLNFLDQPALSQRLAHKARDAVRDYYDWNRIAAEWERLFELNLASKSGNIAPFVQRPSLLQHIH